MLSPRQLQEVEAAQAAAQAALLAELALMRQQKASAEEQARRADHLVSHPSILQRPSLTTTQVVSLVSPGEEF